MTNRYSKTAQFWEWFARHKETYAGLHTADNTEYDYRMRELDIHLAAYGKNIQALFEWVGEKEGAPIRIVFTAGGKAKFFGKIERLVAKAPEWPRWEFIALEPPRPIDFLIQEDFGHFGFDPFHCWFDPVDLRDPNPAFLIVYADTYADITDDWHAAAAASVYNVLGEKGYGDNIACVECHRRCDLTKKEREKLLPLTKLPQYCRVSDSYSAWHVDQQGLVKKQQ